MGTTIGALRDQKTALHLQVSPRHGRLCKHIAIFTSSSRPKWKGRRAHRAGRASSKTDNKSPQLDHEIRAQQKSKTGCSKFQRRQHSGESVH